MAKLAGIADTRWGEVERGYRRMEGQRFPVRTSSDTLARMALALDIPPVELVTLAGYDPHQITEGLYSADELLRTEIGGRLREATSEELRAIGDVVSLMLSTSRAVPPASVDGE